MMKISSIPLALAVGAAAVLLGAPSCSPSVSFEDIGCTSGLIACSGACVDVTSDPEHCGACGNACEAGAPCEAGVCGQTSCTGGLIECGGACVDIGSDPEHCGACFTACAPDAVCADGLCQGACPGGLTDCGGACVDITGDPQNCGGCGVVCPDDAFCQAGTCQAVCPGLTLCGGVCVDITSDEQNCGGCGNACEPGGACINGQCQSACDPGLSYCNGVCVDTQTDAQNCGGCGLACPAGQPCQGGACVPCNNALCGICDVQALGSMIPQTANGTTMGAQNHFDPTCSPDGSGENAYTFTASAAGGYVFDTFTSGYDTVLALLDAATCMQLSCNDDTMGQNSKITAMLAANQTVLVVVDGWNGAEGPYALHVDAVPPSMCPDGDLGSMVPQTFTGSTSNAGDDVPSPCTGQGGVDKAYLFTAPMAGTYVFDTFGSAFDTVLHVHDGGCTGMSLGCNDDTMGMGFQSQVSVALTANQTVVVVVDGFGAAQGNFTLHINVM